MNKKQLLKHIFQEIFSDKINIEKNINNYFSKNYRQWADGVEMNLDDFIKHIKILHEHLEHIEFDFNTLVCEDNILYSTHHVKVFKKNKEHSEIKVIARFSFDNNNKIYDCDELTKVIKGSKEDTDLGSRL